MDPQGVDEDAVPQKASAQQHRNQLVDAIVAGDVDK